MRIITATFVYSDSEYLEETLKSVIGFGDKHFIVEGSWKSAQKNGASERSDKATYDIINKYVDNKKVFLVQANEAREREQRQIGLEIAKKENADWFFMTDADEVYTETSLAKIKNTLQGMLKHPLPVLGFRLGSYNFINSFKRWYNGDYMRIFRVTPDAHFYMDNDVKWPGETGVIGNIPGKSFFHYNYVKQDTNTFWLKMKYQSDQDPTFWKRFIDSGQYKEEQGQYKIPDDCPIYTYTGKHPAIMKEHPYFKQDIYGDGEIEYE